MTILCSAQQIGYYGLMTWLPYYLSVRHGLSLARSAVWTSVTVMLRNADSMRKALSMVFTGLAARTIQPKPATRMFYALRLAIYQLHRNPTE